MTRFLLRTALLTILGSLVFVLFADSSADACHRRQRRRCDCDGGCYGGGYGYQGKYGGAYYRGGYGAPVAPYAGRVTGDAALGARGARRAIEGEAGAQVSGTVRSPSDRARVRARAAGARGGAAPPPPPPTDDLPAPRSETPAEPPAEPSSPPATPETP